MNIELPDGTSQPTPRHPPLFLGKLTPALPQAQSRLSPAMRDCRRLPGSDNRFGSAPETYIFEVLIR